MSNNFNLQILKLLSQMLTHNYIVKQLTFEIYNFININCNQNLNNLDLDQKYSYKFITNSEQLIKKKYDLSK